MLKPVRAPANPWFAVGFVTLRRHSRRRPVQAVECSLAPSRARRRGHPQRIDIFNAYAPDAICARA